MMKYLVPGTQYLVGDHRAGGRQPVFGLRPVGPFCWGLTEGVAPPSTTQWSFGGSGSEAGEGGLAVLTKPTQTCIDTGDRST